MTETNKALFPDSVETAGKATVPAAENKPELDFSFFDEQPVPATATAQDSDSKPDIDFSFFDEPAPSFSSDVKHVESAADSSSNPFLGEPEPSALPGVQHNTENDFAFFGDPVPAKPALSLNEKTAGDAVFSFEDEHHGERPAEPHHTPLTEESSAVESVNTQITFQSMVFACIKCSANVAVEFPGVPTARLTEKCPACSAQFAVVRESSAQRAHRKTRELYCCSCSHQLGHYVYCPTCGQFCPDYFLVEDPKEAHRKARESRSNNFKIVLANLRASLSRRADAREEEVQKVVLGHASKASGPWRSNKKLVRVLVATVVLCIILGASSFLYLKHEEEKQYVATYVKTVYALHTGSESVLASMAKTSAEWKSVVESGKNYVPRPDSDTGIKLAKINSEAAKLLQQLQQKTPKKYEQAYAKLLAFNAEYTSLQNGMATSPASLEQLNRKIEAAEKSVKQKKQEIKAGFTEEIKAELEVAKTRYRGLATF